MTKPTILRCKFLPPTLNDIIAAAQRNRYVYATMKRVWTNKIATLAKRCRRYEGQVHLEFTWKVKNGRRDADNLVTAAKFIIDGLVKASIIKDDSLKYIPDPPLHWANVCKEDGFTLYIYDEKAWKKRLTQLSAKFQAPKD